MFCNVWILIYCNGRMFLLVAAKQLHVYDKFDSFCNDNPCSSKTLYEHQVFVTTNLSKQQ